ncbi:SRPBCC family protein [Paenibacillus sp. GCM10023252]|uniref:SRPBCC family protein n=1 Tax=Paenibacillus sp. GCM10023252 TaxID=3252649 RepID=UPI003612880C
MAHGPQLQHTETEVQGRELTVKRRFHAPRELVFQAWTETKHLLNWWGPEGFTITQESMDVKQGGSWIYVMHGPDGTNYNNVIRYVEVERPERIEYTHGEPGDEEQFRVSVAFADNDGQTDLTMIMVFKSAEELKIAAEQYGAIEGAKSTLNRLEQELATIIGEGQ